VYIQKTKLEEVKVVRIIWKNIEDKVDSKKGANLAPFSFILEFVY
jgi:hypothetical protein